MLLGWSARRGTGRRNGHGRATTSSVKAARDALFPYVRAPHWHVRDLVVGAELPEIDLPLDEEPEYNLAVTEADMARAQQVFERLERALGDQHPIRAR